ncbi:MAG: class I SAM-dependent methyltransferase [Candidatus Pacebacteria bacterium]|nr:class I SAM-dependent methyltransferase [Candidatus Paceibacterota bacterium]
MNENNPQKIIEKTRDDYDLIAKEWDLSRNRSSVLKTSLISEIKNGNRVLDLGCGNALMLPLILKKGGIYAGLDLSEKLIEIAKEKYKKEIDDNKASFFIGQATKLPFENKKFDFVISFAVLHHIPSEKLRKRFFEEIKRVSRSNAKVKVVVWNLLNEWSNKRFDIKNQLKNKNSGDITVPWKATEGKIVNRYVHQFSKEELLPLAEKNGFRNIKIDYFNRAGEKTDNGEEMVLEMEK